MGALPDAPSPKATAQQVREFLINVFMISDPELRQYDAEILAKKLRVSGAGLYLLSSQTLIKALGDIYGEMIYKAVQYGQYGYVSLYSKYTF